MTEQVSFVVITSMLLGVIVFLVVRLKKHELQFVNLDPMKMIASRMKGQDNLATANPIFIVQQKSRIYGVDLSIARENDGTCWIHDGEEVADTCEEFDEFVEEYEIDKDECQEVGYVDIWEDVQPFFSRIAADEFIKGNRHNMRESRVFVDSAYRNWEWQAVRELLGKLEEE